MSQETGRSLGAVAFFGGGTGGHLFPGIAVADRARERYPGCRAVFFRTDRSVEDRVFEGRDVEIRRIRIAAPGRGPRGWLRYWREVRSSASQIRSVLAEGFQVGFGLGGYALVPGILAARRLGIPVILLEQNRVPGKVNRLFAPWVGAVACSYPGTRLPFCRRLEWTGNPVRRAVLDANRLGTHRDAASPRRTVLVVGGSQGARGVNQAVRDALPHLAEWRDRIRWIHVTGDADKVGMMEAYRTQGWEAEVVAYSPDLPDLMARSDLFLGRAGGTTLAELTVMGLPSVLVPYPYHRDQQQLRNAEFIAQRGGARVVPEAELNAGSLHCVFEEILFEPETLVAMGDRARGVARPEAADAVLDLAVDLNRQCLPAFASSS